MQRAAAILFDIDGTLIDTGGAGSRSWREAFQELYGIPADIGASTNAGMTDPVVCRATFKSVLGREPSREELDTVIEHYVAHLPAQVASSPGYKVLPGVEDCLEKLSAQGFLLGLTSGAMEQAAQIKLQRAGLNKFFSFGGYGSDSEDRTELTVRAIERAEEITGKPLDRSCVLVVGDTPLDIKAAHAAKAIGVGIATGKYSVEQLRDAKADYVLASLKEPLPGTVI